MPDRPPASVLSPRLERLVALAAEGVPDKAIATELGVSPHTIDAAWRRLRKTLGTSNRAQTIARCLEGAHERHTAALCDRIAALEREAEGLREANARLVSGLSVVERMEASARAALPEANELDRLRQLERAVDAGDTVVYEGEVGGPWRKRWATENCARFGLSAASFVSGETRIADLMPAEDTLATMAAFERALAEGAPSLVTRYRIRQPDGSFRWVRDRMTILRDARGQAVSYLGSATDVTDLVVGDEASLRP